MLVTVSISIETLSFKARAVAVSAVNGVATERALYAIVGFAVNIVVPLLFMSITVFQEVEATTQTISSAPITIYGLSAYRAFATLVIATHIAQAIANITILGSSVE